MKLKFMDPDTIMGVVVALIILAVGIFAFYITIQNIPVTVPYGSNASGAGEAGTSTLTNATYNAIINASGTGNSVFNIVGVVLIIGAIMTIVGLVYSYIRPRY